MCDMFNFPVDYKINDPDANSSWESNDDDDDGADEDLQEDKIILETEISLKSGPNITMKIHEENKIETINNNQRDQAILRVLDDESDEFDFYNEAATRSPRKVRFGGESFKLRTPESDENQTDNDNNNNGSASSIKITVTEAVSIKTQRSFIPVRISSVPSSPQKENLRNNKQYKSVPNLSSNIINIPSKIPIRKPQQEIYLKNPVKVDDHQEEDKSTQLNNAKKTEKKEKPVNLNLKPPILKHSRGEDVLSPIPIHDEIEVLHNLMRSPERDKKVNENTENSDKNEAANDAENKITEQQAKNEENVSEIIINIPAKETENESSKSCEKKVATFELTDDSNKKDQNNVKNLNQTKNQFSLQHSLLSSLTSEEEIWSKSEALESVVKMLKEPGTCESLEPGAATLLFEALFACHCRDKIHNLADVALTIMIENIRQEVLEQCLQRLILSLCKMGTPSGVRSALVLINKRIPPRQLQSEILSHGHGHRTREGALQILMACARLYPTGDVEVVKITEFSCSALRDRRRRVRHAALETLAATAQLSSTSEVLNIAENSIKDFPDFQEIMSILRIRLSRKQLPTINLDGSIRYSIPVDQNELNFISGINPANTVPINIISSSRVSSSTSSNSSASVNYWMHNLRHEQQFNVGSTLIKQMSEFDEEDGFEESSSYQSSDSIKKSGSNNNGVIQQHPIYLIQPELPSTENGRGHRKYDRGRSSSPPQKQNLLKNNYPTFSLRNLEPIPNPVTAKILNSSPTKREPQLLQSFNGFRKSFSSDQLYNNDRKQELHILSSSRSSSTSTGSSYRSGLWYKSAIPIPIADTKWKIRHNTQNSLMIPSIGPLIVKRSPLSNSAQTQTSSSSSSRSHHHHHHHRENDPLSVNHLSLPPQSSGSESSGYYTPSPPQIIHPPAFIKIENLEERLSSDDNNIEEPFLDPSSIIDNNNEKDCVDSASAQSVISGKSSEIVEEEEINNKKKYDCLGEIIHDNNNYPSSSVESINSNNNINNNSSSVEENNNIRYSAELYDGRIRRKSKSVVDLSSFLPQIGSAIRKSINSAPPRNAEETLISKNNSDFEKLILPPAVVPPKMDYNADVDHYNNKEQIPLSSNNNSASNTKKPPEIRRFTRNTCRKSIKASPRVSISEQSTSQHHHRSASSKPKDILQHVMNQMENNSDWETVVDGIQNLGKLTRENPEIINQHIHQVCVNLAKQIRNLRSQVSRVACSTAGDLFLTCKRGIDMEFEEIACSLFQRTADTNRFIRADANAALDSMCEHLPIQRIIPIIILRGCGHQNAVVRAAAVRLLSDIVNKLGAERVFSLPKELRDKLLLASANSLADGNLETRSHGKMLFRCLIGYPNFQKYLYDAVPQNILRHISKVLSSIKIMDN